MVVLINSNTIILNLVALFMFIPYIISVSAVSVANNSTALQHSEIIANITSKHKCKNSEDCSNNGVCNLSTFTCQCEDNYSTYISNYLEIQNDTQIQELKLCNYEKKDQLTAFMLSLFIGFGAEHFYLEKNDVGISKLVFYCICCAGNIILFVIYLWFPNKHHLIEFLGQYEAIYMGCGFIVSLLWVIYDLIMIGNMSYIDGNKIPMNPW